MDVSKFEDPNIGGENTSEEYRKINEEDWEVVDEKDLRVDGKGDNIQEKLGDNNGGI